MKVFLGNAPWHRGNRLGIRAGSRWPFTLEVPTGTVTPDYLPFPFLLAYATAVLEQDKIPVMLVDAVAEGINEEEFLSRIRKHQANLVLLETSTPSINVDLSIAERIKDEVDALVALCGPHVTVMPKEVLQAHRFVDYILMGEFEYTLRDLVRCLKINGDLHQVSGIAFRSLDGAVQVNSKRLPITDLDELPWPARHFLPMLNYRDLVGTLPQPSLQIWSSRGCPYQCIFCLWPEVMYGGHQYRVRNPKDVVDEIAWCVNEYGFQSFYFDDDTFNIGKARVLRLCEEIKERALGLPWAAMARADIADREMLEAMAKAGLVAIKYGVESGVQELVDRAGKRLDLAKVLEIVRVTKELGIRVHLTFTFGLPGETRQTIQKTIRYAQELEPDSVQFSITVPFPGTQYFQMAEQEGLLLTKDWSQYDGTCSSVVRTEELGPENLEEAFCAAQTQWERHRLLSRVRKHKWHYLMRGMRHPWRACKVVLGAVSGSRGWG